MKYINIIMDLTVILTKNHEGEKEIYEKVHQYLR